jgi:hypothetical protein
VSQATAPASCVLYATRNCYLQSDILNFMAQAFNITFSIYEWISQEASVFEPLDLKFL